MSPYDTHTRQAILLLGTLALLCAAPGACTDPKPQPVPPTPPTGGFPGTGGAATGGTLATGGSPATGGAQPGGCSSPEDDCKAAECRLQALGCTVSDVDGGVPLWQTPAGTPFAVVCRAREADGDSMCPACLARIATCADRHACKATSPGVCQ